MDRQDTRPETIPNPDHDIRITFEVPARVAPALRSAIEEIRNEVGGRLEGQHSFAREQAITDAVIALGKLAAAVNAAVPNGDPFYR